MVSVHPRVTSTRGGRVARRCLDFVLRSDVHVEPAGGVVDVDALVTFVCDPEVAGAVEREPARLDDRVRRWWRLELRSRARVARVDDDDALSPLIGDVEQV